MLKHILQLTNFSRGLKTSTDAYYKVLRSLFYSSHSITSQEEWDISSLSMESLTFLRFALQLLYSFGDRGIRTAYPLQSLDLPSIHRAV